MKPKGSYHGNKICEGRTHRWTDGYHSYVSPLGQRGSISNEELRQRTQVRLGEMEVRVIRWKWIGHVCRMKMSTPTSVVLRWTADRKRKRGGPKETWRRSLDKEMREKKMAWEEGSGESSQRPFAPMVT